MFQLVSTGWACTPNPRLGLQGAASPVPRVPHKTGCFRAALPLSRHFRPADMCAAFYLIPAAAPVTFKPARWRRFIAKCASWTDLIPQAV
jgi:hypothetical protein